MQRLLYTAYTLYNLYNLYNLTPHATPYTAVPAACPDDHAHWKL